MRRKNERIIQKKSGAAFTVKKGARFRIVDIEGKQVADLVSFSNTDHNEKLSTGATIDCNGSLAVGRGDILYSNRYRAMLTVEDDSVGRHDILHPACSRWMYVFQYGIKDPHPSCLENLANALSEFGIDENEISTPFNIFMNTRILPNGKIHIEEPLSNPGDYIELRAEMDMIVAISACCVEESACNAYRATPLKVVFF
jgi:uncharacterized protein YcgI (DUF1989 family)